jgi:hypothetical protein
MCDRSQNPECPCCCCSGKWLETLEAGRGVVWAPALVCAHSDSHANSYSHRDTATKIEATSERALLASNASYELLKLMEGRVASEAQQELEDR